MSSFTATSLLQADAGRQRLDLATARGLTPAGAVEAPTFFSGFVERPDITAAALLAVADNAAARYDGARIALLEAAAADPVVTASGDRMRFESFSACNSVHARFDLLADGIATGTVGFGTTNVDINPPLRRALARVHRAEPLHLAVGPDELRASSLAATHVERKVSLPDRWVRGLAETPARSAALRPVADLGPAQVAAFARALPRVAPPGPDLHLVLRGSTVRLARGPVPGSVLLPAAGRLRPADRLLRFVTRLRVHADDHGFSAWTFDFPGGRLLLMLTPDPFRGFSGEGTLLTLLAGEETASAGERVLGALGWSPSVDRGALAAATGLDAGEVEAALAWLAASGRLGHDLATGTWFHRELPIDAAEVVRRNPRLVAARRLVDDGAVRPHADGWRVRSSHGAWYDTDATSCTCRWTREHGDGRGPCKHRLAVVMAGRTLR